MNKDIIEYCYSHDEDYFTTDFQDAVESAIDSLDEDAETVKIYRGKQSKKTASGYLDDDTAENIAVQMQSNAFDAVSEHTESWMCKIEGLKEAIEKAVDKWADDTNNQPTFYNVYDVKPMTVRVSDHTILEK